MGIIRFPEEVRARLSYLDRISILRKRCTGPLAELVKNKPMIPISLGSGVSPDRARGSLTTTAIAANRLRGVPNSALLFARFLNRADESVRKRQVLSSGTFGDNNPITAAFVAQAFAGFGNKNRAAYRFAIRKLLRFVEGRSPTSIEMPARGYPSLLIDEALKSASSAFRSSVQDRINKVRGQAAEWAFVEAAKQIACFHSSHSALFDVGELAFATLLACRSGWIYWSSPLTTDAVRIVFESQAADGLWHSTKPFWYTAGRGYFLASSQIMSAILELLRRRPELYRLHEKRVMQYVSWLEDNIARVEHGPLTLWGWAAEAHYSRERLEPYITLENLRVLQQIKTIVQQLNRDDLLQRSGLSVEWEPMRWGKLLDIDAARPEKERIKRRLDDLFAKPFRDTKKLKRCSLVLYGPPGTSKTTIAEALADKLGALGKPWPFITITPGDFIAGGEQMAEINATNIFQVLMELNNVVILFDEIDELLRDRQRPDAPGGALRYMNTSMLTKFQALRKKKKNIFVLTTNRFETLDSAIRRAGRFDRHVAVMPPDKKSRQQMLSNFIMRYDAEINTEWWKKLTTKDLAAIASQTCLFTIPELQVMTYDVLDELPRNADKAKIKSRLLTFAGSYSRATTLDSYENRDGADKEIAELLTNLTKGEYGRLTQEEKNSFKRLVTRIAATQFNSYLPNWMRSSLIRRSKV